MVYCTDAHSIATAFDFCTGMQFICCSRRKMIHRFLGPEVFQIVGIVTFSGRRQQLYVPLFVLRSIG